jgi:hypothetical protein
VVFGLLLIPATLLFGRWNWLVPVFIVALWLLLGTEHLQFDKSRTIGDQLVLFEQSSLLLLVSFALVKLRPWVLEKVRGTV